MSDNLRDRIAKVLHRQFGPSLGAAEGGWDDEPKATRDTYRQDADAVIAELGMTVERDGPPIVPPCRRYVTEWIADG